MFLLPNIFKIGIIKPIPSVSTKAPIIDIKERKIVSLLYLIDKIFQIVLRLSIVLKFISLSKQNI